MATIMDVTVPIRKARLVNQKPFDGCYAGLNSIGKQQKSRERWHSPTLEGSTYCVRLWSVNVFEEKLVGSVAVMILLLICSLTHSGTTWLCPTATKLR